MDFSLALSGGALRGAAHIGFLEVIQNNGLKPNLIAGTSAGSIVGSLYAAGALPQEIGAAYYQLYSLILNRSDELFIPLPIDSVKTKSLGWIPLPKGILKGNFIEKFILNYIGSITFEDLLIPLAITATDLNTGELIVFTTKKLIPQKPWPKGMAFIANVQIAEAVRASSAIPGIFTPKEIRGRQLLDGGLVDNVPTDVLKILGGKNIIAVDLGFGVHHKEPFKNMLEILLQAHDIMGQRISNILTNKYADLVIYPEVGSASLLDFGKIPSFIQKGREACEKKLDEIKNLLNS